MRSRISCLLSDVSCNERYSALFLELDQIERFLAMSLHPGYTVFHSSCSSLPLPRPLGKLATRPELTNWLHRIFLKLALPPPNHSPRIFIPQAMTLNSFVKLLCRLHEVGYPSHWLSAVLQDLLADRVVLEGALPWD
jgi:hypothetical protein